MFQLRKKRRRINPQNETDNTPVFKNKIDNKS